MIIAKILSFFTILGLVLADLSANNTQSTYINITDCTLNYNSLNDSFAFLGCNTPQGTTINWFLCLTRCCNNLRSIDYNKPSLLAIAQCKNYTAENSTSVAVIVMGILIGGFALIVILCFCMMACKIFGTFQLRNRLVFNTQVISEVQWPQQKLINNNNVSDLLWSKNASQVLPLKLLDTPCSICLEDRTTAELICRHQYHPNCIGKWFYKSDACPCCRHQNIKGIKVFCEGCRWKYIVCTRNFLITFADNLVLLCQECKSNKKMQNQEYSIPKNSAAVLNNQGSHHFLEGETFIFQEQQIP